MPELNIVDRKNKKVGTVEASQSVFEVQCREELVQRYVTMQLATRRGGNAATKQNKGELHGTGAKPWRQKGTGRARAGNTRSPIWRGGMTVFGPSPRSYAFGLSKKSKKIALKAVLTDRLKGQNFTVVDSLNLENPKTKEAVTLLANLGLPAKTLFIVSEKTPTCNWQFVICLRRMCCWLMGSMFLIFWSMKKLFVLPRRLKKLRSG